jgi:hypothetical protein
MTNEDNRATAVLSLTIRGIERDLERTPSGRGGIISFQPATPGIGGSGTPGDNLLADWRELEAALAAERDRADRAEARLSELAERMNHEREVHKNAIARTEATA